FAGSLSEAYESRVLSGKLFRNDHFLTVVVFPRTAIGKIGWRIAKSARRNDNDLATQMRSLEDLWQIIAGSLGGYGLRRLGIREKGDVLFTEIGEALRLIMTCRFLPVPMVTGS
ncbi:MAG: type IV secretion system protein VirB4, partial [Mesorhizobium sp.]